jgi:hypothetical protein
MEPLLDDFTWPLGSLRPAVRTRYSLLSHQLLILVHRLVRAINDYLPQAAADMDSASDVANAVKPRCIAAASVGNSTEQPRIAKSKNDIHPAERALKP